MRLPVVLLLLGLLAPVHAADVTVNYLVDDSALKDAASGSLLQPTLFTDAGCTHELLGATLAIDDVRVSRLNAFKPKHAPKAGKMDLMTFTLTGVPPYQGALYLLITGVGVSPVGNPCQVQSATAAASPLTTSAVTLIDENGALGFRIRTASDPLIIGASVQPVTREAAAALTALAGTSPYDCTVEYATKGLAQLHEDNRLVIFNVYGCASHVPSCTDGLKNQDETDIDCGGNVCARRCPFDKLCSDGTDCESGGCLSGRCTDCNVGVNPTCGGTCPTKCQDGTLGCLTGADCKSGVCQQQDDLRNLCAPARCNNGVKDGPETDIDCGGLAVGGAFCGGCTTGKSCVSSGIQNSNCVSQACTVGGVCQ